MWAWTGIVALPPTDRYFRIPTARAPTSPPIPALLLLRLGPSPARPLCPIAAVSSSVSVLVRAEPLLFGSSPIPAPARRSHFLLFGSGTRTCSAVPSVVYVGYPSLTPPRSHDVSILPAVLFNHTAHAFAVWTLTPLYWFPPHARVCGCSTATAAIARALRVLACRYQQMAPDVLSSKFLFVLSTYTLASPCLAACSFPP